MSKLKIEISLGDDSLANDEWGSELQMVLESVVRAKVLGSKQGGLYDTCGNKVGVFSID